ncbi:MAG TPA: MgtC/SapB family protein [Longimicrobiales bacterium]|nr:MgtC/SapB family protein [Longimicrobiales bacterium]
MDDLLARYPELAVLRLDLLGKLMLAAVMGGIIGLEREWSGKPAGLRTNLLICVGAALITELSMTIAIRAGTEGFSDPARLAAQIVSGIGFLGAGTILQARGAIIGLTTAATLWVVAAIGIAVGAGAFVEAVGTTLLVMLSLIVLRRVEGKLGQNREMLVRVTMERFPHTVEAVEARLAEGMTMDLLEADRTEGALIMAYRVSGPRKRLDRVVDRLLEIDGVQRVVRG